MKATEKHFDHAARGYYERNYERPRSRHAHNLALRRAACLALLPEGPGQQILDLGCGPGALTFPLLERGHGVISMDASSEMLARMQEHAARLGLEARAVRGDAHDLPFASESFDTVVSAGVLEYLPDAPRALREIGRVLRPGGTAILTMTLPRRLERFVVRAIARLRAQPEAVAQYIYDRAALDRVMADAGFTIDRRRCIGFSPFPLDAVWPSSVRWIDERLGDLLNRSDFACDHAKTYIVRARR